MKEIISYYLTLYNMNRIVIITSLILFSFVSFGQVTSKSFSCRDQWKYLITDTTIQGQLLYFLPVADVGI